MGFVMGICDRVVCLDFGRKIAEGPPAEVQRDPGVMRGIPGDGQHERERRSDGHGPARRLRRRPGAARRRAWPWARGRCAPSSAPTARARRPCCGRCSGMVRGARRRSGSTGPTCRAARRSDRPAGRGARARGARHVHAADRRGEPAPGRLRPPRPPSLRGLRGRRGAARWTPTWSASTTYFPMLKTAVAAGGRQPQRRRAADARHRPGARCCGPRLLLLDEPSLGLAPLVTRELFRIVRAVNEEERTTVVVVEQNAQLALQHRAAGARPGEPAGSSCPGPAQQIRGGRAGRPVLPRIPGLGHGRLPAADRRRARRRRDLRQPGPGPGTDLPVHRDRQLRPGRAGDVLRLHRLAVRGRGDAVLAGAAGHAGGVLRRRHADRAGRHPPRAKAPPN